VFHVLLQILDDGRLTDSKGRTVDFKNTVIIMTSNLGSQELLGGVDSDGEITLSAKEVVLGQLRAHFRPEFLNRVDEIILFKPLHRDEIEQIVGLLIEDLKKRLAERNITMELTPQALELISSEGFDSVYGARPLKRYLQRELETRLSRELIAGTITDGERVLVDVKNGELELSSSPA